MTRRETYDRWLDATARQRQLQLAGYRAYIVAGRPHIVIIERGKHPDLSRLPAPEKGAKGDG